MVLRLDPALPLLWRSPSSVQFGERAVAVFDDLGSAEERLIAALVQGVTRPGFEMLARSAGLDPPRTAAFLARIEPALEKPPARIPRVAVVGAGPLVRELAAQLADAGALVGEDDDPELVVLVAAWVVEPADHGRWLSRDIPHLPVIETASCTTVGPHVTPGAGACLYCVHLARCDADAAWPAIASQLWGRERPTMSRARIAEAAAFITRRLLDGIEAGLEWTLDAATGAVSAREWRRHPGCLCAAPPGSDWARDAAPASPSAPTTATAVAAPA